MDTDSMLDDTFLHLKNDVRATVRSGRATLAGGADYAEITKNITANLVKIVQETGAKSITCYLPVRNEPDTRDFLIWCRDTGIRVLLPACREDMLLDWIEPAYNEDAKTLETVPGTFGIPEPVGSVFSPNEALHTDLMLVPAAAVAENGVRLGWGGGFYDRTLGSMEHRPPVFAIVYESEVMQNLPRDVHDIPVDGAVTELKIRKF